MAVSVYDDTKLTDQQKKDIERYQAAYQEAMARGDQAGMDSAHAAAESVRSQAGYSGGIDGFEYVPLEQGGQSAWQGGSYTPAQLPSYEAQTDAVNRLYDAALEVKKAALKAAFDESTSTLEGEREEIPRTFQVQRNAVAGQSEVAGRNFNEYAAAAGLNSGAGGQAALARANQLQGDLSALSAQEAAEQREIDRQLSQLKIQYQNEIAQAIADGEYQRAAALLQEYQRAAESVVSVAQAQADENYRAWSANAAQSQWQAQFDYNKAQDALAQQNWERQFGYTQERDAADDAYREWQKQYAMSQTGKSSGGGSGASGDTGTIGVGGVSGNVNGPSVTWDPFSRTNALDRLADSTPKTDSWDVENGKLKLGSLANQAFTSIVNTTGDYNQKLNRIEGMVDSGMISPEAGLILLEALNRAYGK